MQMRINLGNTRRAKIVSAVIGQLSDGMWEESRAMNKYWQHATIKGTDLIITGGYDSGFNGRSEEWVRNWFASKLKAVVQEEVGNNKEGWNRNNMEISDYISYNHDISVSECYECYDFLRDRKAKSYAFQLEANMPGMKEFKCTIIKTINDFAKSNNFTITDEYMNWLESICFYFEPHFKHLIKGGFDEQYFEKLKSTNEKLELSWPNITEAAIILERALKSDSNYFYEITSRMGYSMTPDDCFRAIYFADIRDKMFDNIEYYIKNRK